MFIIASWRPMHFEQFATEGRWDAFELADPNYMNDPRAAIHEFAAILAGENREAYSVEFARYYQTQGLYSGMYERVCTRPSARVSARGTAPVSFSAFPYISAFGAGNSFWYRGSQYYADAFGDCYRRVSPYQGYGFGTYRIAGIPRPVTPPSRPRLFDPEGHRTPMTPKMTAPHMLPTDVAAEADERRRDCAAGFAAVSRARPDHR